MVQKKKNTVNAFTQKIASTELPALARDPQFYGVLDFWLGLEQGFLRFCSSALSLSTDDTGMGVEPLLSCGDDVGVADELGE